jgi:hypothetical protein
MRHNKLPALDRVLQRLALLRMFLPLVALSTIAIGAVGYLGEQSLETQQHRMAQSMARLVDAVGLPVGQTWIAGASRACATRAWIAILPYFRQTGEKQHLIISAFISLRTGNPTVYLVRQLSRGGQVVGN